MNIFNILRFDNINKDHKYYDKYNGEEGNE